jgi:hypothetical protein
MPDPDLTYWTRIEPILQRISIYDGEEEFQRSCEDIPRPLLLVAAAHVALAEVQDGGFLQFFMNSTGIFTAEAIEGFHELEMPRLAAVFSRAAGLFGKPCPRKRKDRWDAMLIASGHSREELETIFTTEEDNLAAFAKATQPLDFESMNQEAWDLAANDHGDFEGAATRYLTRWHAAQRLILAKKHLRMAQPLRLVQPIAKEKAS